MKDAPRQQFRWAPHTSGATQVKPKDYQEDGVVEAASPYAAWFDRKDSPSPLEVGDLRQLESGELRIYKYVGFEEARWVLPESKPVADASAIPVPPVPEGAEFRA
ncbi:MAG: hypothetical protein NTY38_12315 [Acidobacteria bacterium]|nr:hypothetical protein [Acidobacteriota bacterium]